MAPTARQLALLRYVHGYQLAHGGVSPSYRRCADGLGLASTCSVHRLIHGLRERGLIRLLPGRAQSIEILQAPAIPSFAGIPLYAVPGTCSEA